MQSVKRKKKQTSHISKKKPEPFLYKYRKKDRKNTVKLIRNWLLAQQWWCLCLQFPFALNSQTNIFSCFHFCCRRRNCAVSAIKHINSSFYSLLIQGLCNVRKPTKYANEFVKVAFLQSLVCTEISKRAQKRERESMKRAKQGTYKFL